MRSNSWWLMVFAVALIAYGYLLDGLHTPKVGDEYLYLQVSRVTAESGAWLPLLSEEGINNRKPPLMFWVGMIASNWGSELELLRFRLPILLYTLLTAGLVFLFTLRMTGERAKGWIAALSFLAFFSTFKYGRNFLTNMPEAFFTFLAVYLVAVLPVSEKGGRGWLSWVAVGAAVGGVLLHRSIVLVAPIFLVLGLHLLIDRRKDYQGFLRFDVPRLSFALAVACLCFGSWFALDPNPGEIIRIFFLDENLGKMNQGNYFKGLFVGNYNLTRIWTGHLINAGLFVVPISALVVYAWRERHQLGRHLRDPSSGKKERLLWLLVFVYIVVFTFPHQRSPSYLISGTPALAVLLGIYWNRFPAGVFRLSALPFVAVYLLGAMFAFKVEQSGIFSIGFSALHWPVLALGLTLSCLILARPAWGSRLLHLNAFVFLLVLSGSIRPLETSEGRFDEGVIDTLRGTKVHMPSGFRARYERYRYLLPGAEIVGYDPPGNARKVRGLLEKGFTVGAVLPLDASVSLVCKECEVLGSRIDLRTRHNGEELRRILFNGDLGLLFQREVILRL